MRTLLTHEWLASAGGSENVFEQLAAAIPESERLCLWNEDPERFADVRETWLARTPVRRNKAAALPLMRSAMRSCSLDGFDRVVSSSHAFGHYFATLGARAGLDAFAYVHSPARYIWAPEHDHRGRSPIVRMVAPTFQMFDRRSTDPRVKYAANSEFVRARILDCWGENSTVIHPPVRVEEIARSLETPLTDAESQTLSCIPDSFVLGASRLVAYKRLDLVIRLGESLGLPVIIAGDGPYRHELETLAQRAAVSTQIVGRVTDRVLFELFRRTKLFAFLPIEDFGIMPLEAIAAGAPVVVNAHGGAWEGVRTTGAGTRSDTSSWPAVVSAARDALELKDSAGRGAVQHLSNSEFQRRINGWIGA